MPISKLFYYIINKCRKNIIILSCDFNRDLNFPKRDKAIYKRNPIQRK